MRSRSTPSEDRAAAWAARLQVSPLTHTEAKELQSWLDENSSHEPLLDEFMQLHQAVKTELPVMAEMGTLHGKPKARPNHLWVWSGGLAAAAALAFAALWINHRPQEITTLASQRQEVILNDGSHVSLNARTALAVSLRDGERHVHLESGEAYFQVAKDRSRPFIIETPAGSIRVTGTRFNVRADVPDNMEVTVIEGSVAVHTPISDHALEAGDQLGFNGVSADVRRLDASDALDIIAWRDGRIVCDGVPLRVALARFARYHGITIDVAPSIETLPLGGIFKLDDLDGFLRDITLTFPVQALRNPAQNSVRILPR